MDTLSAASQLHRIVGDDFMIEICTVFGGQTVYIPQHIPDPERDSKMTADFNRILHESTSVGSAFVQIGEAYDVSPRTVRRAVCGN